MRSKLLPFPDFHGHAKVGSFLLRNSSSKMQFGDLKSAAGLKKLNDFLVDHSYVEGYTPSQADVSVFGALNGAPKADLVNALRWYNQINSYVANERTSWPGEKKALTGGAPAAKDDDSDSDFNFSDSDDEDEEERERIKAERVAAYNAKKSKKPGPIAKSNVIFDVKPWDDETDLGEMEKVVRKIECDGLLWGASKLVPMAYGIKKLQIASVIVDDKVSTDWLEEMITANEDIVQSVDIAAFNKI